MNIESKEKEAQERIRKRSHILVSVILLLVILILKYTTSKSAIDSLMFFAGFTYGPLIGMFFFGIITKREIKDKLIPVLSLLAVGLTIFLWYFSAGGPGGKAGMDILGGYNIGFELIIFNALITFGLFLLFSKRPIRQSKTAS